jgi:hypothetical protein
MNQWETPQLSLAAFAICQGARLIGLMNNGQVFKLESNDTKSEVTVKFMGSDESKFNMNLIQLQNLRRGKSQ